MIERAGEWYFTSRPCLVMEGFLAWCAKSPDLGENPLDPSPELDVHFEFGATAEEAIGKLKRKIFN